VCPACRRIFSLPPPLEVRKHARTTTRAQELALSLVVQTNGSLKTSGDVTKAATHLSVPRQTLHRWKQSAADRFLWSDVISKLNFSGILCVDEYRPKRSDTCDLFATDRLKGRILYLDETEDKYAITGDTAREFFLDLKRFSVNPRAIIADMSGGIWKGAKTVFPDAFYQYDYFHVVKSIHEKLRAEIRKVWWDLTQEKRTDDAALLWDAQWALLRNQETWTDRDEERWLSVTHRFSNTIIARLPAFKQELRGIFDESKSVQEATQRRDAWIDHWRSSITTSRYLKKIVSLLTCHYFPSMVTYLDHREIPRTTNAETLIRSYRKMEKARYGFGSIEGRKNHLKLYQVKTYLSQKVG